MTLGVKSTLESIAIHLLFLFIGFMMVYPIIWMLFAAFKTNHEIFASVKLLPAEWVWDNFRKGWAGTGRYNYTLFFINSFKLVVPVILFTVVSSTLVGYGFARFKFIGHGFLFALMISTVMLPNSMTIIPRYLIFRELGWINSYLPFYVPALFAGSAFFVFLMVQFFRGIPKELDEAAAIDGCGSFRILIYMILPLSKAAIISIVIFQFIWMWNDFFNSVIFLNDPKNYTVSLGLRMAIDASQITNWNQILAMSLLSILPSTLLFFFAQKYFVEGISTTGIKA